MDNKTNKKNVIIEIINYPELGDFIYAKNTINTEMTLEKTWSDLPSGPVSLLEASFASDKEIHILVITDEFVWAIKNKIVIKRDRGASSFKYDVEDKFKNILFGLLNQNILKE